MPEKAIINCMTAEAGLAEEVKRRLELAGIQVYFPPAALTARLQADLVEKIQTIAAGQGCMLCLLSNQAIDNSLFMSNIQLMCESAGSRRVLVTYAVETLENEGAMRLFASQALPVKRGKRP